MWGTGNSREPPAPVTLRTLSARAQLVWDSIATGPSRCLSDRIVPEERRTQHPGEPRAGHLLAPLHESAGDVARPGLACVRAARKIVEGHGLPTRLLRDVGGLLWDLHFAPGATRADQARMAHVSSELDQTCIRQCERLDRVLDELDLGVLPGLADVDDVGFPVRSRNSGCDQNSPS